ncbi:MAG: PadR family transcriptional regulator [Planctomycetota bacterium]
MEALSAQSRRDLFRGSLETLVLAELVDGPRYGYAIQRRVEEASGQAVGASVLYPLLHRLESAGYVEPSWEDGARRPRKWYTLTESGRAQLKAEAVEWQAVLARLQGAILPALRRAATRG